MSGRADRLPWRWVLALIGVAALVLWAVVAQRPSPTAPPAAPAIDRVRVVSSTVKAVAPVRHAETPPVSPEWTGPERGAVVRALRLPTQARLVGVTGMEVPRQVLCGRIQISSDQPSRRFTYVKTAKLGAIDDGGAEFAQAYGQLCGQ
jgi:hypothetical protein